MRGRAYEGYLRHKWREGEGEGEGKLSQEVRRAVLSWRGITEEYKGGKGEERKAAA